MRRGGSVVPVEPQVFDLLQYLIRNRERVVSKDDLLADVWNRRVVSDSTLSSRITAVRHAVGDSGARQRLIRTMARKGFRFVGPVREQTAGDDDSTAGMSAVQLGTAERRQLTIMECDAVEKAGLSTRRDPEELREFLDSYYQCVKDIVARFDGWVAKQTDGEVVAYFGYPRAHEDDAEQAVRAGLALVQSISVRVGIATGLVLVENPPDRRPMSQPTVIGEIPYAAGLLARSNDAGAVSICANTRRLTANLFDYCALEAGPSPEIARWRVLRESAVVSRFEALHTTRKPLIGRGEELALLLRRWQQAKSGEGRVVLLWGEPGIGKSHLAAAFQEEIQSESHACLRYFCSPHRRQTALHPVVTQLEHAAGFAAGDDDRRKLDKLERLLARSSNEPSRDITLFADLLSISTAGRYATLSLSAQRRKELLLEAFVAHLVDLAARQPVLMVLEDAHWIDPTTRELFDIVVERVHDLRALLVLTYRPEFNPPWLGRSHVTTVTLTHLGRRDNAALIKQIAGGKALPEPLVEQVISRTDGVPLFIEEVTKSILESGIVREEANAYILDGELPTVAVPSTLQASLVARLDRIAPARAVVQIGAALGREFRYEALKAATSLPDSILAALINQAVASELVHQRGDVPHALYSFKHALVQDAAYATIPRSERPAIHRRIADALEAGFPDIALHHPDVLAHHCTEAALPEKAIDYWIKAARVALSRSAGIEAQSVVEKAMSLLPKVAAGSARQQIEGRLQLVLGDALVMTKGFASPQAMNALSRARELLGEKAHPLEALGALCGLFNYHLIRSESSLCLKLVESRVDGDADRPSATVVNYLVGTAHLHLGNFTESIRYLERALALYDEDACRPVAFIAGYHLRSFTLIWLGLAYLYAGSFERAAETISIAVTDARKRLHPFTLVSALLALARFRHHTGDLDGAIAATEEGMAIAIEQRSPYHVSRASVLRAVNVVASGHASEGLSLMEQALAAHRATGANFQSSYNLSCIAEAHAQAGNNALAAEFALEAIAEVDRSGEKWWEAEAHRIRGEILLKIDPGNRNEAEACFKRALAIARRQGAKLWEQNAAQRLAKLSQRV